MEGSSNTGHMSLEEARKVVEDAGMYLMKNSDIERFAQCAAEAYINYPLFDWWSGSEHCSLKNRKYIWLLNLRMYGDKALIYAESPECKGWTMWFPEGFRGTRSLPFIFSGGWQLPFRMGVGVLRKMSVYEDYCMKKKGETTGFRDWYLYNAVVRPGCQRNGIFSCMIKPVLAKLDEVGCPAYLETHKEVNTHIYRNFGFDLVSDDNMPGTHLTHWAMVYGKK